MAAGMHPCTGKKDASNNLAHGKRMGIPMCRSTANAQATFSMNTSCSMPRGAGRRSVASLSAETAFNADFALKARRQFLQHSNKYGKPYRTKY